MPSRGTRIEIDPGAIAENAGSLLRHVRGAALIGVVKADGYGHGLETAARAALAGGATMLAVATVEEGLLLRERGIGADILMLGTLSGDAAAEAARKDLTLTVYSPRMLPMLERAAEVVQRPIRAHVQIETGMRRLGVLPEEVPALLDGLRSARGIRVEGVYSHFAETSDAPFVEEQLCRYGVAERFVRAEYPMALRHMASSGAALSCPESWFDAVRCGIAMYGYPPCGTDVSLRPALRFVTEIAHLQTASQGESVSYGRTYRAAGETLIATLPVGYGDGYPRCIGNVGYALVRGMRAPVIGRVCMDLCMLDVTGIPGVSIGDEVVLMGEQGGDAVSAEDWAVWCGTIAYEALLRPTARVPRIVL